MPHLKHLLFSGFRFENDILPKVPVRFRETVNFLRFRFENDTLKGSVVPVRISNTINFVVPVRKRSITGSAHRGMCLSSIHG